MKVEAAVAAARAGRLYPSVILHGGEAASRRAAAVELARTLLCERDPEDRPCGSCTHCRRIRWPEEGAGEAAFHPDFLILARDLKATTSVDATRELLRTAQLSPFEARGQVFVIASAESLSGEAANALLKSLEEPHLTAPRHFLLLAPSRLDLLPTLRSRSLALFLGASAPLDAAEAEALARDFGTAAAAYAESGATIHLLTAAGALLRAGGWEDPRAGRPWALAAAAVLRALPPGGGSPRAPAREPHRAGVRRAWLALAADLLSGPDMRARSISPERIVEGLVSRHLS